MTFVDAFKLALGGMHIRRGYWRRGCYLEADGAYHLICVPNNRDWAGPYKVSLADVEATDWSAEDPL